LRIDLNLQVGQTVFGRMLFENLSGLPEATRDTEQLCQGTGFQQVLLELFSAHFCGAVALVGASMQLESATIFF